LGSCCGKLEDRKFFAGQGAVKNEPGAAGTREHTDESYTNVSTYLAAAVAQIKFTAIWKTRHEVSSKASRESGGEVGNAPG
jgi:hypothetical protein